MGYDLHITRRENWSDHNGPAITKSEWQNLLASQPDLAEHLYWERGEIVGKNPDEAMIRRMALIAKQLGARVEGDEGETYDEDGSSDEQPQVASRPAPGLIQRIKDWFAARATARSMDEGAHLKVGQRVIFAAQQIGTVIAVDRNANGGLGSVKVRFDDGHERNLAYVASGLEIVTDDSGSK